MPKRTLTPRDVWTIPQVGGPEPSPDGKRVIVPVVTPSVENNDQTARLWLMNGDGSRPRVLTTAESSSGQPAWSPDGSRILFVRRPGGRRHPRKKGRNFPDRPQIHVMPVDGGEPERLTDLPLGAIDPKWFPDGRRIAFAVPLYADAPTPEKTGKLAARKRENPVKAHVTEERWYRFWDRWLTDRIVHHVFVLDLETRRMLDVTPDSKRYFSHMDPTGQYDIAPDGREIAFAACRATQPLILWGVFTAPVPRTLNRAGRTRCLTSRHPADAERPRYTPDGRSILYGIQRETNFYADRVRLVRYDRRSRTHTVLTEQWPLSATGWTFGRDPKKAYLLAEVNARTAVFSLDIRKPSTPKELSRGGTYGAPRVAGGRIFATLSTLSRPGEVHAFSTAGRGRRRITRFTASALKDIALAKVEEFTFRGAYGVKVQMFLLHPPGSPKRKKLPLVHMIHGGPHGVFGDQWHPRWNAHAFAAPGYRVALVNFQGSTSWGQDFAASILGGWGDRPYKDIEAATDLLVRRGLVDPKRMAVTGGSYGGFLVSWICSQTARYACAVNHAGVCDFQTQYAADVTQGRSRALGGEPWENVRGMDRYNPMRHARGFRTPMLVIHGMNDYRVPHAQGLEIYNVYKAMKRPARLVIYPDENHWVLKPRNSLHWYGEVLGWLKRWLRPSRGRA